jgi:hypothetical protein
VRHAATAEAKPHSPKFFRTRKRQPSGHTKTADAPRARTDRGPRRVTCLQLSEHPANDNDPADGARPANAKRDTRTRRCGQAQEAEP